MKKIIALITIFILSFSSGYAVISNLSINLTQDELLKAEIFYIAGEGYTKDEHKLKKVEGVKFYSIAGQPYMKKDGKITKMRKNRIIKIHGTNFVIVNKKVMTLQKYLAINPAKNEEPKTFSNTFNIQKPKLIKKPKNLTLLSKKTIKKIKEKTLNEALILLAYKDEKAKLGINKWISKKKNQTKENFEKLKNIYLAKQDKTIAKKFEILENIEGLDIDKINKVIKAKQNNNQIKFSTKQNDLMNDFENIMKEFGINEVDENTGNNIDKTIKSNSTKTNINDLKGVTDLKPEFDNQNNETNSGTINENNLNNDEDLGEFGDFFKNLGIEF